MSKHSPYRARMPLQLLMWLMLSIVGLANTHAASSLTTEAIINLPNADAWALFTTETGLNSLGYTQAKLDLQLGGAMQAGGGAVALPSMNGEIISMDPEHMLSFRPADHPANNQWTVLYFTAMGKDMTQLRWLEFFPDDQRAWVSNRQQQVHQLFEQLIRRYAPECEVCKLEKARAAGK